MSRLIVVPYLDGLVNYKGEDSSLFNFTGRSDSTGIICEYSGISDNTVWADYVDTRPVITITDITSTDPSFFYNKPSGFIAVKQGVNVNVVGTITNLPVVMKWNTPLLRNGRLEGYAATETNGLGAINFTLNFPLTGDWVITEKSINKGVAYNDMFLLSNEITAKVSI